MDGGEATVLGRDLDDAERWVADWSASISERAERARRLAERVAELIGSAEAAGGLVEVRVDSGGALVALHLDDRLTGWPAARVEREIMTALRRAQAGLTDRVAAAVADTVGADSETGRAVLDGYDRRFPAPDDGSPGARGAR
ncbi:YbaB/EbfC family nucleoid-associated protein [Micromonospora olivasterospora]|uniref:YbaB/EbfC family nucleoid-associated protein n=1 Tax=Micromonospora olivasterospora TaxID=1880 RepID=UPI0014790144|nr:YbaB/EbfC family nucleoid-associated protein [Micromonospora olivasterospora]